MTLTCRGLEVRYGEHVALRATTLELIPGQLVALVGPNGAGKSSLLRALAGLAAHSGDVAWHGTTLRALAERERARAIAFLPQAPTFHWPLLARELVALGRLPHRGYAVKLGTSDAEAIDWALRETATHEFADRSVDRLSVGERARVLLARALAVRAPVLLVDEPTAMLDPLHQLEIMALLRSYSEGSAGQRAVVVAVLHDLTLAARFCHRVLVLDAGTIAADDAPRAALSVERVRRHYGVEPFVTEHSGEAVIVPWRPLRP